MTPPATRKGSRDDARGASRDSVVDGDSDFQSTLGRPSSLWPDSSQWGDLEAARFAASRFDPLAEEQARLREQAAAASTPG